METPILKSRKFWLLILDVVTSSTLFFVGKYLPLAIDDVKFVVLTIQPVFLLVIGSITAQNLAGIRAESDKAIAETYKLPAPVEKSE